MVTYEKITYNGNKVQVESAIRDGSGKRIDTNYATIDYVDSAIDSLPAPMVFKGTVGTNGTIASLPAASTGNTGFTYKALTDHAASTNPAYPAYKAGDSLISTGTEWVVIPSGDEPSGTVTNVSAGVGLAGGPVTTSGSLKAKLRSETALTNDSAAATETSGRVYPVAVDKSGYLAVNVPWTENTDKNVLQRLQTGNYNLPLLMSYQVNTNTTGDITNISYRNNSIYANTSTGVITANGVNATQVGGPSKIYELQATGYKAICQLDKDTYWTANSGQAHIKLLVEYSRVPFGSLATLDARKGIWVVKVEYSGNDHGVFIESVGDSVGTGDGTLRYFRSYTPKNTSYGPQIAVAQENANVKVYIRVTLLAGTPGWTLPASIGSDPGTTNYNQYTAETGRYNYHWSNLKLAANITGSCDGIAGSTWDSIRNDRYVFGESAVAGSIMAMASDGRMYKLRNGANKEFTLPLHCGRCTGTFTYDGTVSPPTLTNYAQIMWVMRSQAYAELTNTSMQGTAFTVPTLTAGQYGLPLYVTGTLSNGNFKPDGNIVTAMVNGKTNIQIGHIDRANTALNAVPTLFTIMGYAQTAYTLDNNGKLTHVDGKPIYNSGGTVTSVGSGTGLTGGPITGSGTLSLATSGVSAGNYGPSSDASPAHGGTFTVPYITVDTYGRATAASNKTITLPGETTLSKGTTTGSGNAVTDISVSGHQITLTKGTTFSTTDTKNTAGTTNKTGTKMYLTAATEQSANPQTYSNSNCYIGTDNCLYSNGTKVLTSAPVTSVNSKTGAVSLTASDVSAVPTSRTVNSKALSSDITLSASDVSALPSNTSFATINSTSVKSSTAFTLQNQHSAITISIATTSWNSSTLQATVSATGVTASNTVIVSPAPASYADYGASGVYCSAQASGTLTFTCTEVPSVALSVNVVILN